MDVHGEGYPLGLLPPYALELNPEELCNQNVKSATLNSLRQSIEELRAVARGGFRELGKRTQLLESSFEHAGVSRT